MLELSITPRQQEFISASSGEVLFGGAAGGGKSYGQLVDALLFALKYPKSKQLILRRTLPELEKSLIRTALELYPRNIFTYKASKHEGFFKNGSVIDFGYCDSENDVYRYQSAEYDIIRFDELTHFTEQMYVYLISRVRGANSYPKQIKSSTNPGGIGHTWVKARFIDIGAPNVEHLGRIFIPSKVTDNSFLMNSDPGYVERLKRLSKKDREALLFGNWDIFDGQYFTEWNRDIHVLTPFNIPKSWRRYFVMDYGLDMLAGYWIAVDMYGRAYVYREIYESGLIISEAARRIRKMTCEDIYSYIAPPDLWNRRQDTGKSAAQIFAENGVPLTSAKNDRVQGWYNLKEWLSPFPDETGKTCAALQIFSNCTNLIRCLPAVCRDSKNPNDVASTPHELTHAPDAIRYFVAGRPVPAARPRVDDGDRPEFDKQIEELLQFSI
ncbi:MAG: phage terminase large subunit [Oscillospiraceae bacterium]|nr:phage terminase large subunit [Oscillospiraceae bacterium]